MAGTTLPGVALPEDVVRTPSGRPAVVLVRTARGWTPIGPGTRTTARRGEPGELRAAAHRDLTGLPLVEAMSLADLLAEEAGASPEPDRQARLAARRGPTADADPDDPRDAEIAALRRTVGQLEHALAARVSIERAIGVLAERHGTSPREAFDELRRRARSATRPAQDLAREVLDGLAPLPEQRTTSDPPGSPDVVSPAAPDPDPTALPASSTSRRVARNRARSPQTPGSGAGPHS